MDINNKLKKIIDFENYPIHQASFISKCRDKINNEGCVVLPDFLNHETINQLILESKKNLKITDLTGAGDLFAAGFLHGHVNNMSLKESLDKGTEMSSKVIQQIGARL